MLFYLIILAGLFFLWTVWFGDNKVKDLEDVAMSLAGSFLVIIGTGLVLLATLAIAEHTAVDQELVDKNHVHDIVSIDAKTDTEGNFALGTGYMKGEEYYYMFAKLGENRYKRVKIKSDISEIVEDANKDPYVERWNFRNIPNSWIAPNWVFDIEMLYPHGYEIHVPENTVIKKFKVR